MRAAADDDDRAEGRPRSARVDLLGGNTDERAFRLCQRPGNHGDRPILFDLQPDACGSDHGAQLPKVEETCVDGGAVEGKGEVGDVGTHPPSVDDNPESRFVTSISGRRTQG